VRWVGAEELRATVSMSDAIDALERAFKNAEPGQRLRPRTQMDTAAGSLLLMPAAGDAGLGIKLVTVTPGNPGAGRPYIQAAYVLFDPKTQEPLAVMDGTALTALRTGAVSGLATRLLARPQAVRLVIFGSGVQARAHLEAMCAVRSISAVTVISRNGSHAAGFADDARDMGLYVRVGTPADVEAADIVCTCTTSERPLFDGRQLAEGAHVNAVGAFRPELRELDTKTVARSRLVVEHREAALAEAGDLIIPIAEGAITSDHILADLGQLARGAEVRRSEEDVTLFKSVGIAFEDLVIARAVLDAL
jgi:ornithine cyclodeaminase/alanine dehydrogenase-like protein (mu-crystallin family)